MRVADAHQDVDALVGEIGDAVLAGDGDQVELHLQRVGDVLRDVDVIALEAHVGAGRGEGREVGEDADIDDAGLGDVVERVGIGRPGGKAEAGAPSISTAAMDDLSVLWIVIVIPLSGSLFVVRVGRRLQRGGRLCIWSRSGSLAGDRRAEHHQAQDLEQHLRAGMRRVGGRVILRRDLDDVAADDVEALEAAQQLQHLARRQAADLRRAGAGREGRIEAVDVEGQIGRAVADDLRAPSR